MDKIKDLRFKIDKIDKSLLDLISERLNLVREIGELKKRNGVGVIDKNRELELFYKLSRRATEKNINPEIVKKIWKVLIEISYEIEGGENGNS